MTDDGVLAALGLSPPVLNAAGPVSRVGGSRIAAPVRHAMAVAAGVSFDMPRLHGDAGRRIAALMDVPAAMVTSGAAAALALGAAAVIARNDLGRMNRLPRVEGMPHEFLIARSHRNGYDRAVTLSGARLTDVGLCDRISKAGVRDVEVGDFADAIGPETAGILYVMTDCQTPPLADLAMLARSRGLVLLVDAAGQMSSIDVPARLLGLGADLVAISGGKALGGPAGSGLLIGDPTLIASALLQSLDTDYPAPGFIDDDAITPALGTDGRLPAHGIGRPLKVGKEGIVGIVAAVSEFAEHGPGRRRSEQEHFLHIIADRISDLDGLLIERLMPRLALRVAVHPAAAGMSALEFVRRLETGQPAVKVGAWGVPDGYFVIFPSEIWTDREAISIAEAIVRITRIG